MINANVLNNIMKDIRSISTGNKALEYIANRISRDDYRGDVSSQHNRYTRDDVCKILTLLDKYAPNGTLMRIRDADLSTRPYNIPDEEIYAKFCNAVHQKIGKGTQDSIRKNYFVDFHRMGLIKRYDKDGMLLQPLEKKGVKFVSISKEGLRFIKAENILNQSMLYTKCIDRLLGGFIENVLNLLNCEEYNLNKITQEEFLFFVSAIGFNLTQDECFELISSYRCLAISQKKYLIDYLSKELIPAKFDGDKTKQRDWHNWKNKNDQIMMLFGSTPYFCLSDKNDITLNQREIKVKDGSTIVKLGVRSNIEKEKYLKYNDIKEKVVGFELHHVIPLFWAESPEEWMLFDKWENMIYVDSLRHVYIHNGALKNIMEADGNDLVLKNFLNEKIKLKKGENILYDESNQKIMLEYNKKLNEIFDSEIEKSA